MPFAKHLLPAFETLVWVCYAVYLGSDLGTEDPDLLFSRVVKYVSIVLCFAISLWHPATHARDAILLRSALALTVLADLCIGILDQFLVGTAIFAVVHLIYVSRHRQGIRSARDELKIAIPVAAIGITIMAFSAPSMQRAGLLIPSLIYSVPLMASLYAGLGVYVRDFYSPRQKHRIAVAMVLFFITDILVAHVNAAESGNLKSMLGTAVWILYLPSQYLLAISGRVDIAHMFQEKYPKAQVSRSFSVEADKVFDAFLDPRIAGLWLFATEGGVMKKVTIDGQPGGKYSIIERRGDTDVEHTGTYAEVERPRRLVFTLSVPQFADTADKIEVTIAPKRKACDLTLVHHLQPGAGIHAAKAAEGWTSVLSRLASVLE